MRIEQTSLTTFELQTDNGCRALAGMAINTMGVPGVYMWRDMSLAEAEKAFLADPRVLAAKDATREYRFGVPSVTPMKTITFTQPFQSR